MKQLIIHADDLGMCHSVNKAIFDAFETNSITSASVMVPCSWFPEVAIWAKTHREFDLGIHLTFTSEWNNYKWRPLVNVESFVDKYGYMLATEQEFAAKASAREVGLEAQAQIQCALDMGIQPSHVDSHMFTAYSRKDIRDICEEVAAKYGLQFKQIPTIIAEDPCFNPVKYYGNLLCKVSEGISQLIVHPAYDSPELVTMTDKVERGGGSSRIRDMFVLESKDLNSYVHKYGITLISWRDVKEQQEQSCV